MNDIHNRPTNSGVAVAYLRTATAERVGSRIGLKRQRRACEQHAQALGLRLGAIYADVGVSGLPEHRLALDQLTQEELPLGRACYLITADQTRLSRSMTLQLALELQLGRYGVKLVVASQTDNTSLN